MSEDENKNPGCFGCIGCFGTLAFIFSIVYTVCFSWFYLTGRMIMWCDETTTGVIAHYSDGHLARCKRCFKNMDSDGITSWAGEDCVPIVESVGDFTLIDSGHDSNSDTGI